MNILLTGATGFLGSHVAEQLSQQGHTVHCLVRRTANIKFLSTLNNIELIEGHLGDEAVLARATQHVDAIIHAASIVKANNPADFDKINVKGTLNLLNAARQHAPQLKRFVFVSSMAAIGASKDGSPVTESNTLPNPTTYYGRSKLEAEQHAMAFSRYFPLTIVRPAVIYGPRDKECLAFFKLIKYKMFPFFGSKQNTASVIYAPDAAQALIRALHADTASGNAYYIEDGETRSSLTLITQIAEAMKSKLLFTPEISPAMLKPVAALSELYGKLTNQVALLTRDKLEILMQPHWVCSSEKARRELNWQPTTDWATGVKLTYDWYKQEGWL